MPDELDLAGHDRLPLRCDGQMEREPGRLQLRYALYPDELMYEIEVEESDNAVVVSATVCSPPAGDYSELWEIPFHVYLDRPLGGRVVIDANSGRAVPHNNVYARLMAGSQNDTVVG